MIIDNTNMNELIMYNLDFEYSLLQMSNCPGAAELGSGVVLCMYGMFCGHGFATTILTMNM